MPIYANYTCKLALTGGQLHMQAGPYGRPITHASWPLWEADYTWKLALMGGQLHMQAGPYGGPFIHVSWPLWAAAWKPKISPGSSVLARYCPHVSHHGGGCTAFNMSVKHSTLTFTYAQTLIILNTVLIVSGMYLKWNVSKLKSTVYGELKSTGILNWL